MKKIFEFPICCVVCFKKTLRLKNAQRKKFVECLQHMRYT